MKKFTRCISLLLALVLILAAPVSAASSITPYASNFFMSHCTYLKQTSDNQFVVWFDVVATTGMDELGVSSIVIERSRNGSTWVNMRTCTKDYYPQMICEDTGIHGASITHSGTQGYYYRAYVTFYAKNGNSIGELSDYTEVLYLQSLPG